MQAFPAHFSRDEIEIINAESSESADTADKDCWSRSSGYYQRKIDLDLDAFFLNLASASS